MSSIKLSLKRRRQPRFGGSTQRGFVLVLVVFLIVVLGGAAVAISRLTIDTSGAQNQALLKTRAQWFNQSGIEWAVNALVTTGTDCTNPEISHADFPGLTLSIECTESPSYGTFSLWTVTATTESAGQNPNDEEYVWQSMTAVVER